MSEYRQFCPVAKASEALAERWTPLVVRELLCGSRLQRVALLEHPGHGSREARTEGHGRQAGEGQEGARSEEAGEDEGRPDEERRGQRAKKSDPYGCGACGESFPTMNAATQHAMTHTAS
jgi:hypothetical protein